MSEERVRMVSGGRATRLLSDFDYFEAGTKFYVGPNATGAGDDGRSGRSKESSLATLTKALTLVTASKGDTINLLPGHAETIATAIDVNKIGVNIVGLGSGDLVPAITCNAAIDCMDITVADVSIFNVRFPVSTLTGVTSRINVGAANCVIEDCLFDCGEFDTETITIEAGGDDLTVKDCKFVCNSAATADAAIEIEAAGVDGLQVIDCHFDGYDDTQAWDTGAINSGAAHTRCLIKGNTTLYGPGIIFSAAATGMIVGNYCTEGTLGSMIDPGSCMCIENYESDAVDETGALFPQATPYGTGGDTELAAILADTVTISGGTLPVDPTANSLAAFLASGGTALGTELPDSFSLLDMVRGKKVSRVAADVFDGTQTALFTVSGGRVLVKALICEVSVAAIDGGASNTSFVTNPTVGTDAAMCAVLDINADENGTIYALSGNPANALTGGSGGGASCMDRCFVVPEGTVDLLSAADVGTGGALGAFDLWYIPLDTGATVVAA